MSAWRLDRRPTGRRRLTDFAQAEAGRSLRGNLWVTRRRRTAKIEHISLSGINEWSATSGATPPETGGRKQEWPEAIEQSPL